MEKRVFAELADINQRENMRLSQLRRKDMDKAPRLHNMGEFLLSAVFP